MAHVRFELTVDFAAPARVVWDEMVDWKGHEAWIPATTVEVRADDPTAVGAEFTAWTGFRPLALEDRMRVVRCDWDDAAGRGDCEVDKLGPVLAGRAGFTVVPDGAGSQVRWFEDVTVKWAPGFLAPVLSFFGALGFKTGMRKLDKQLRARAA